MHSPMEIQDDHEDKTTTNLKIYLEHKIKEIKLLTAKAQEDLKKVLTNEEKCLESLRKKEHFGCSNVQIKNTWQKLHNGKWILGICTENTSEKAAENINVILKCNFKGDFNYSTRIYTKHKAKECEEIKMLQEIPAMKVIIENYKKPTETNKPVPDQWLETQKLINYSVIIVLIDIPSFIEIKTIELSGLLIYEQKNNQFQVSLPTLTLPVKHISNDDLIIKYADVIDGLEDSYLSILATSKVTHVKIILPEGIYRTLEGLLQIDCFFTKTAVLGQELVLLFDGKSQALDYTMLKICTGKPNVKLITKNDEQLYILYHHLYTNIPGVVILHEDYECINDNSSLFTVPTQTFSVIKKPNEEDMNKLLRSFDKQLQYVENNLKKCCDLRKNDTNKIDLGNDYAKFRKELCVMEKNTDLLISKINVT